MQESIPQRKAKIILCKCTKSKGVFGIRLEEQKGDWVSTWAFKIDEDKARREGFDRETVSGSLTPTPEYPGCPWCGSGGGAQCECGRLFCDPGDKPNGNACVRVLTCPWCGKKGEYFIAEKLTVQGGGF